MLHSKGFKQLPMHDSVSLHRFSTPHTQHTHNPIQIPTYNTLTIPFKSLRIPFNRALIVRNRADFDELVMQSRKQVEKGENVFRPMCVALPLAS